MSVFLRILRKKEDYKLATLEEKMCIRVSWGQPGSVWVGIQTARMTDRIELIAACH